MVGRPWNEVKVILCESYHVAELVMCVMHNVQAQTGAQSEVVLVCMYVCMFVRCCLATKTLYLNNTE